MPTDKRDHDDPIVADNSPARFNFSKEPSEIDPKNFERNYTAFEKLTLVLVDGVGSVTTQMHSLEPESDIVFHLVSVSNTAVKEQVSLTAKNGHRLKIKANKALRKHSNKAILESSVIDDLRFTKIEITDASGGKPPISLFEDDKFLYVSVVALIKAQKKVA